MPEKVDVAIVGAGIVACAAAREMAAAGASVLLIERERPGAGATGAAAGILTAQAGVPGPGPLLDLSLAAREGYPALADELRRETGLDAGLKTSGLISLAFDPAEEAGLEKCFLWQREAGLPVERLSAGRIRSLEPAVSRSVRSGLLFPSDHHLDTRALIAALAASALARGARILTGRPVETIEPGGDGFRLRAGGSPMVAQRVLVAAGCWSAQIGGPPSHLPVRPVRGQIVLLEASPPPIRHVIMRGHRYLVPRERGEVIVGSTTEEAGFEARVTAEGVAGLLAHALLIVPELAAAALRESWAGLRPATPDGLPIVGPSRVPGLHYATGLYRSGILLGPLVGRIAAEWMLTGKPSRPMEAFDPARYGV